MRNAARPMRTPPRAAPTAMPAIAPFDREAGSEAVFEDDDEADVADVVGGFMTAATVVTAPLLAVWVAIVVLAALVVSADWVVGAVLVPTVAKKVEHCWLSTYQTSAVR